MSKTQEVTIDAIKRYLQSISKKEKDKIRKELEAEE